DARWLSGRMAKVWADCIIFVHATRGVDAGWAKSAGARAKLSLTGQRSWARPRANSAPGVRARHAGVAELADALDLGSSAARRGGSTPLTRTNRPPAHTPITRDGIELK